MPAEYLTDRRIKALNNKPAKKGGRYEIMDTLVPGFGVRVNDKGRVTFILNIRYPGKVHPERRTLGRYSDRSAPDARVFSLSDARDEANRWRGLVSRGIDPKDEIERERQANASRRANTFAAAAEDFITEKLASERRGKEAERDFRREFIPVLGSRPISEITDLEVLSIIKVKRKTAPTQARNLLALVKRFFVWAKEQRVYGLSGSPIADLKPAAVVGRKNNRDRVLSDDELFALWRATRRLPYPAGPVYRILTLSALRLNEAAEASREEFDRAGELWTIPAQRMKGRTGVARAHVVPLTSALKTELAQLPKFTEGPFLFTTTLGEKPAWIGDKIKKKLDERMTRTLRALARVRGEDASKVTLKHWINHDIRRTVRSNLSRLKVTEEAREAVLAHVRPGIKGVYDVYDYLDEKREALELWAARLDQIVSLRPAVPSKVVELKSAG